MQDVDEVIFEVPFNDESLEMHVDCEARLNLDNCSRGCRILFSFGASSMRL